MVLSQQLQQQEQQQQHQAQQAAVKQKAVPQVLDTVNTTQSLSSCQQQNMHVPAWIEL
jgi:hypothetical protein